MENENQILNELKEISPQIAKFEKINPYSVSVSYFDNLATTVVENIKQDKEPTYYFSREMPFFIPQGYFKTLPDTILKNVLAQSEKKSEVFEEMETISPLLNTISKKPVYAVPGNYLENTAWHKNDVVVESAKVVRFSASKKIVRFAAAAVVAALLAVGIFLFTGKQDTSSNPVSSNVSSQMNKLSEQEIIDFLKTNSPTDNITSTNVSSKDNDIKKSVSEMSDKEIQQFLQEYGEQDEI